MADAQSRIPNLSEISFQGAVFNTDRAVTFTRSKGHLKNDRNVCRKEAKGCYVNTVCVDGDLIQSYIQYPEKKEKEEEQIAGLYFRIKG